jgi:DnaJ-class molecular chaperone
MSHTDPQHDPENVRIEDAPYAPTTPCPDCDGRGTFIHPPGDAWYSSSLDWCGQCDGVGHVPAWDEA